MAIKRNFLYNLIGSIIPILVGLVTIPIYLRLIGEDKFGVLSIVWLILGYFSLFNLGMGKAITVELSNAEKTNIDAGSIFSTALILNIIFSALAVAFFFGAYYLFGIPIKTSNSIIYELTHSINWISMILPLAIIGSVLGGVIQAYEKFLLINALNIASNITNMIVPIFVAKFYSNSLAILIPVIFTIKFGFTLLTFFICLKLLNSVNYKYCSSIAKKLLSFGGWVTLTSIISPLMVIMDRLIISNLYGAKFVTFYSIPYQLTEKLNLLALSVSNTIYTRIAKSNTKEAKLIAIKSIRHLVAINTPLAVIGLYALNLFLTLWISKDFAISTIVVAKLLLVAVWINGIAFIPDTYLQATGRPNINAKIHTLEVIPYLILLFFCLKYFGIEGAAIATGLRFLVDLILLSYFSGLVESLNKICLIPLASMIIAIIGSSISFNYIQLITFLISESILAIYFFDIYIQNINVIKKRLLNENLH